MQVFCPRCGASSEVDPAATKASCSSCGEALPVHLPTFGPPTADGRARTPHAFGVEDMAAVPHVVPPKTKFVWNEQQLAGGAWVVSLRTGGPGCFAVLCFACTIFASYAWGTTRDTPVVVVTLLAAFAIFFGYKALCRVVNHSLLRVDSDWVSVRRGPMPEGLGVRVMTSTILRFMPVRTMTTGSGAKKTPYFAVQAVAGNGTTKRLPLGKMLARGEADYACERLMQMLTDAQKRGGGPPIQTFGVGGVPPFQGGQSF
jgi:hypothetical protein